jgi:23S rRNA pseudouridine1911/1915/1917 synthase
VHLSSIGHPIVGDDTYGGGGGRKLIGLSPRRHFLHAAWLVFRHPVSDATVDLRSPLPKELRKALTVAAGPDAPPPDSDPLVHFDFYRDAS